MDTLSQPKADTSAYHKELRRKSQDRIKVNNPTDEDFIVYIDKYGWRVRAKSTAILPRYIALNYVKHFLDHVKLDFASKAADEEDAKRSASGKEPLTLYDGPNSRYHYEQEWRNRHYNEEKWVRSLWLGIVEEYGRNLVTEEVAAAEKKVSYESIIDSLENLKAELSPMEKQLAESVKEEEVGDADTIETKLKKSRATKEVAE